MWWWWWQPVRWASADDLADKHAGWFHLGCGWFAAVDRLSRNNRRVYGIDYPPRCQRNGDPDDYRLDSGAGRREHAE
jgi:hypothetical protein